MGRRRALPLCLATTAVCLWAVVALADVASAKGGLFSPYFREPHTATAHISMCIAKKQYYLHYLRNPSSAVSILQNVDVDEYRAGRLVVDGTVCLDAPTVALDLQMGCVDGKAVGEPLQWNISVGAAVAGGYLREHGLLVAELSKRRLHKPIDAARIRVVPLSPRERTVASDSRAFGSEITSSSQVQFPSTLPVYPDGLSGRASFYSRTDRSAHAGTHFHDMLVHEVDLLDGTAPILPPVVPILAAFFSPLHAGDHVLSVDINAVVMVVTHQIMALRSIPSRRPAIVPGDNGASDDVDVDEDEARRPPVCSGSYISSAAFGRRAWLSASMGVRPSDSDTFTRQIAWEDSADVAREAVTVLIDIVESFNTSEALKRCPWQRAVNGRPSLDPSDFEMWSACRGPFIETYLQKALGHPIGDEEDLSYRGKKRRLLAAIGVSVATVNATLRWHWPAAVARVASAHRWWECRRAEGEVEPPVVHSCVDAGGDVAQCTVSITNGHLGHLVCALTSLSLIHADGRYFILDDSEGPYADELLAVRVQQNGTLVPFQFSRCAAGPLPPLRSVLVLSRVTFFSSVVIVVLTLLMCYFVMGQTARLLTYSGVHLWPFVHLHSSTFTLNFLYLWPWELSSQQQRPRVSSQTARPSDPAPERQPAPADEWQRSPMGEDPFAIGEAAGGPAIRQE